MFADGITEKKVSELRTMSVQTGIELLELFLEDRRRIQATWEELNAGALLAKSRRQQVNSLRPRIREESVSGDDDSCLLYTSRCV